MNSYKCFNCNGSYYRCGTGQGKNCEYNCDGFGGIYCWEKEVVLILQPKNTKKIKINGRYDGYGRMYISDKYKNLKNGLYWKNFDLYPYIYEAFNTTKEIFYKQLCIDIIPDDNGILMNEGVSIYCKSCYDN
tara:strand:+ start:24 stop:419 length:396 start_codon:yes stop_codon:yes gene_type:complete